MWMSDYIRAIQRQLIDQYGFAENPKVPGVLLEDPPDGDYPMVIDGKLDRVKVEGGYIDCCNFDEEEVAS